jgi:hypothetical protein
MRIGSSPRIRQGKTLEHAEPSLMERSEVPTSIEVTCGPLLCQLQVFAPDEWAKMSANERPPFCEFVPLLGWVGVFPIGVMN